MPIPADSAGDRLRFLQVHNFYRPAIQALYGRRPDLKAADYRTQNRALIDDGFSAVHMIAPAMAEVGYGAELVVANAPAQLAWAREQGIDPAGFADPIAELVRRQIALFRPDILYLSDAIGFDGRFLATLDHRPRLVLGWRGSDIPAGVHWRGFDIILSAIAGIRRTAVDLGAKAGEDFMPGFPAWIADRIADVTADTDLVFVGQYNFTQHPRRSGLLRDLAVLATMEDHTARFHVMTQEAMPPELAAFIQPPVFGLDMHRALRRGRIAFDSRVDAMRRPDGADMAGNDTANMRLFEATGSGRFVITPAADNLDRYFEPGVEVETYADRAELLDKVSHYLAHPEAREAIAARGRARCLADHTLSHRARQLDTIIRRYLG